MNSIDFSHIIVQRQFSIQLERTTRETMEKSMTLILIKCFFQIGLSFHSIELYHSFRTEYSGTEHKGTRIYECNHITSFFLNKFVLTSEPSWDAS